MQKNDVQFRYDITRVILISCIYFIFGQFIYFLESVWIMKIIDLSISELIVFNRVSQILLWVFAGGLIALDAGLRFRSEPPTKTKFLFFVLEAVCIVIITYFNAQTLSNWK